LNVYLADGDKNIKISLSQAIPGVPKIKEGQNPAAWMLDISSHTIEHEIGVDYAHIYTNSSLYR
jgi:hypothetical protein